MNKDVQTIINDVINAAMPGTAVTQALSKINFNRGKLILVSVGKAAWEMASAAMKVLEDRVDDGIVITKDGHSKGPLGKLLICEAAHPVPNENSFVSTQKALDLVSSLKEEDNVLFLLSGGGSALFAKPLISPSEKQSITAQLLSCGASIVEINTIRKRLSAVKGGRFALCCAPAKVFTIVLSDIIGDPLDMIASGPAYADSTTCKEALEIVSRYHLSLSDEALRCLQIETPKTLTNVQTFVTGSVKQLCHTAIETCKSLGYETVFLTSSLDCQAREAGSFLSSIARDNQDTKKSLAFILGGETVVKLIGKGKGGRNQELALSSALGIRNCHNTFIFSLGSDGTDGPTDAAGGWVDEHAATKLEKLGYNIQDVLDNNDAYPTLKAIDSLIMTGPTGTNVNDLTVILIKR